MSYLPIIFLAYGSGGDLILTLLIDRRVRGQSSL